MTFSEIAFIVLALASTFFFALADRAFLYTAKLNVELRRKQGGIIGRVLGELFDRPEAFRAACALGLLLSICASALLLSAAFGDMFNTYFISAEKNLGPGLSFFLAACVRMLPALILIVPFAEVFPRLLLPGKGERAAGFVALPMRMILRVFEPVMQRTAGFSEFLLQYLFNVPIKKGSKPYARNTPESFVKQSLHGNAARPDEINTLLFENALHLMKVKVRKFMVPRNEIEAVPFEASIDMLREKFISTRLSRILIYKGSIDNIVGYVHQLDMQRDPKTLQDVLHKIIAVPESMSARDLIDRFNKEHKSVAWVVDEFGGTAGMATMEDVLEEVFGDIQDEYDVAQYVEQQIGANEYIFSGRIELDFLRAKYGFDLFAEGAETLSGYIILMHESIPKQNEKILIENYQFVALLVSNTRIETVKMIVPE